MTRAFGQQFIVSNSRSGKKLAEWKKNKRTLHNSEESKFYGSGEWFLPLPWFLASSSRGSMMVEFRFPGERTAVYIRGTDCTTTGIRCTWLGSLLDWRLMGLEGGTGWMMCKNGWPLTPEGGGAARGPCPSMVGTPVEEAEDTEVMTVGDEDADDDERHGERADVTGDDWDDNRPEWGELLALFMDKSTGSVCVWNWSEERKSSGGSALTLLRRRGTASMPG